MGPVSRVFRQEGKVLDKYWTLVGYHLECKGYWQVRLNKGRRGVRELSFFSDLPAGHYMCIKGGRGFFFFFCHIYQQKENMCPSVPTHEAQWAL